MGNILQNIKKINEIVNNSITLVAVSKTKSNDEIMEAYNCGLRDFGENYVQELCLKMNVLPRDIRWHMIGHLQKNKVKYVVDERVYLIHSVDSISLAKEIDKKALKKKLIMNILLEVNIALEESKYGFKYEDVFKAFNEIKEYKNVNVLGLMFIAPNISDENKLRSYFKKMKELNDELGLKELSMGMTNDYKIAIEEGSTIIRIGTGIFGSRNYNKT